MKRIGFIVLVEAIGVGAVLVACGLEGGGARVAPSEVADASDATSNEPIWPRAGGDGLGRLVDVDAEVDAEAHRPDAGVTFVPSHVLATSYRLEAPDVTLPVGDVLEVDTTTLTLRRRGGFAGASPDLLASGDVAVLSVGALELDGTLLVRGARALAIVASGVVTVTGSIAAAANGATAGPGGAGPELGARGAVVRAGQPGGAAANYKAGGGGGGYAQFGGAGADLGAASGGAGGVAYGADGVLLVGGSGGGRGGDSTASGCSGRGGGGAGGGALQISTMRSIVLAPSGVIAVGGGGGSGGCRDSSGEVMTGGGGGGAGGTIVLEAIGGLTVAGTLDARGGGGGQGGSLLDDGLAGANPNPAVRGEPAGGAGLGTGGAGGAGGTALTLGRAGSAGATGGGGGGASGRVFLRARPPVAPRVERTAVIEAVRAPDGAF